MRAVLMVKVVLLGLVLYTFTTSLTCTERTSAIMPLVSESDYLLCEGGEQPNLVALRLSQGGEQWLGVRFPGIDGVLATDSVELTASALKPSQPTLRPAHPLDNQALHFYSSIENAGSISCEVRVETDCIERPNRGQLLLALPAGCPTGYIKIDLLVKGNYYAGWQFSLRAGGSLNGRKTCVVLTGRKYQLLDEPELSKRLSGYELWKADSLLLKLMPATSDRSSWVLNIGQEGALVLTNETTTLSVLKFSCAYVTAQAEIARTPGNHVEKVSDSKYLITLRDKRKEPLKLYLMVTGLYCAQADLQMLAAVGFNDQYRTQ